MPEDQIEETYRITPRGFIYNALGQPKAVEFENALISYMKSSGSNCIILEDNHLIWETVAKEWD